MSLEHGGKADKDGNKYEYEWVICQILQVIKRNIRSFIWEPIGPSSDGVDTVSYTHLTLPTNREV